MNTLASRAEAGAEPPSAAMLTPGSDRDHVLGVYVAAGRGLRCAPVDVATGKLISPGAAVPLYDTTIEELAKVYSISFNNPILNGRRRASTPAK
eukprot:1195870-Prorocentrum_minimum.AAC.1